MKDLTIYSKDNGKTKALYASNNGKWKCLCCNKPLTVERVALLLVKHSANEQQYNDDKEAA